MAARNHYTYLIAGTTANVTKIGHGAKPRGRLNSIRVGCPHELEVAHTWKGPRERQVQMEKALHKLFSWARLRGEWFDVDWYDVWGVGDLWLDDPTKAARASELRRLLKADVAEKPDLGRDGRAAVWAELHDLGACRNPWDFAVAPQPADALQANQSLSEGLK